MTTISINTTSCIPEKCPHRLRIQKMLGSPLEYSLRQRHYIQYKLRGGSRNLWMGLWF